jgi:hypothetical protein
MPQQTYNPNLNPISTPHASAVRPVSKVVCTECTCCIRAKATKCDQQRTSGHNASSTHSTVSPPPCHGSAVVHKQYNSINTQCGKAATGWTVLQIGFIKFRKPHLLTAPPTPFLLLSQLVLPALVPQVAAPATR